MTLELSEIGLSVIIAWFICQVLLKIITFSIKRRKLFLRAVLRGGGMPSAHSATVSSLTFAIGFSQGFNSPLFYVTLVFSVLVIYEALFTKRAVGSLIEALSGAHPRKEVIDQLGHSTMEVLFGVLIGLTVALFFLQN